MVTRLMPLQPQQPPSASPTVRGANQEREALPVTSDEKGALPVARRRKLVAAALLASAMDNTETASAPRAQLRSGRNSALS
jgi:hypothetical protein